MERVTKAIQLAAKCHEGQFDKSGEPYILHPVRVMLEFKDPESRCAAVLHDTVEDCALPLEQIEKEFGLEVSDTVYALSKQTGELYMSFIDRCARHPRARRIKLMDIKDNTRPERYNASLTGLQGRYIKAQNLLVEALKKGNDEDIQFLYDKGLIPYFEYMMLMEKV